VENDWSTPDLVGLLSLLSHREEVINDRKLLAAVPGRIANFIAHLLRTNTPAGSRRKDGRYTPGSLYSMVDARLAELTRLASLAENPRKKKG